MATELGARNLSGLPPPYLALTRRALVTATRPLLSLAEEAARAAGTTLLDRYGHVGGIEQKSSATDPVSDADRAAEALLVGRILDARPADGIVGEEGADRPTNSGLRWVLDPLDGTVNYLYGFPAWGVSVACEDDRGTLVGVVYDPPRDEMFTAVRGEGAHLASTPLRVNDPVSLERALVATGFAYDAGERARQGRILASLLPRVRDVRRGGSAALDLCWLAAGRVDGFYEDTISRWDWAAGALVAAEAGASLSGPPAGGEQMLVAAGRALHPLLRSAVSDVVP